MKRSMLLPLMLAGVAGLFAAAQQPVPADPMPAAPTAPQQGPQPPAKQPNRTPNLPDPMPADMKGMGQDSGNPRAKAAGRSTEQSVQQQKAQAGVKPGQGSDAESFTYPTLELQEQEALELRTGTDLPAPELLEDVVNQQAMTLEQFLAFADRDNPTLAQAQREVDRSNAQARQVGLPPDPVIGYSAEHIRGGSYHGGEEGAFFSQEFVLGRKLALRRDIFRAEGKSNQYALEVQRARVHNDVAQAFFNALTAQQSVVIHDRLLKVALDASTNAHELARVGQADAAAVLSAEIAAEQAKVDFLSRQRDFLARFAELATVAGQGALGVHPLSGQLVEPPALELSNVAAHDVQESPLVKRAEADVALGEARLKDARREAVPNLRVTAGEWYSGEELNASRGGLPLRTGWMSFAQAGVELPLWNRNQGNVAAAQAELSRAQHDVERTRLWTRNRTEPLVQQYQAARFTAERYRTAMLPRARRAYQLQVMKYQQMALAYPEVLVAQHMLFQLQLGYVEALNQEWRAAIALQNYALMDGLDAPMTRGSDSTTMNLPTAPGIN